jgi:TonB family protein
MAYKLSLASFCLFAFAVGAPCATTQFRAEGSAAVAPARLGQEQKKPTPDELSAKPPTEVEKERIYTGKEVDKKPVVKSKPQPDYTREAQGHGTGGKVVLRCIFAADGKVTNIHVVVGLPDGLTQEAIDAASRIKFKPALKDGKPVSMWIELQYNFHP